MVNPWHKPTLTGDSKQTTQMVMTWETFWRWLCHITSGLGQDCCGFGWETAFKLEPKTSEAMFDHVPVGQIVMFEFHVFFQG